MMGSRSQVGIIFGKVAASHFDLAVSDPTLRRLDYVEIQENGRRILGQVEALERRSSLSFDEAMAIPEGYAAESEDKIAATIRVIGYRDNRGLVQVPRSPFRAGTPVLRADSTLVGIVLGLETERGGVYLGKVKGSDIPVNLSMDVMAQKHLSVLAKTGAGKSYTVGVVLEEFIAAGVPLIILDPHGEYGSLRHANMEESELDAMSRFKVRPKSFHKQIQEFSLDTRLNPESERLHLEGMNLEGREVVDMLGGKLSGGQVGVLYQAIKEVKEYLPAYTIQDIMDGVSRNKSSAKWNVLNALEVLDSTGIFNAKGTPVAQIVKPGKCTIINLKGVAPDIQEIVVTRLSGMLWEARKRGEIPAHILVVEEAHNFCPERNVGNAVSGAIIRTIASEGRKFGMGLVIVSQRPAKIDKNVLSQCNTQIVLKVTNPNDLKAIGQSVENITTGTQDEIQRLPIGVALVAGGGLTQPVFVDVRPRLTRHGGRSVSVLAPEEEPEEIPLIPLPPRDEEVADAATPPEPPAVPQFDAPGETPAVARARRLLEPPTNEWPNVSAKPIKPDSPLSPPPQNGSAETAPATPSPAPTSTTEPVDKPGKVRRLLGRKKPVQDTPAPPAKQTSSGPEGQTPRRPSNFVVDKPKRPGLDIVGTQKSRRVWTDAEKAEIHRVASRIGLVEEGLEPDATVLTISRLAIRNGRDPDERLRLYRDIGTEACFIDQPACIRCPLADQCVSHKQAQEERQKARRPVRRLWSA